MKKKMKERVKLILFIFILIGVMFSGLIYIWSYSSISVNAKIKELQRFEINVTGVHYEKGEFPSPSHKEIYGVERDLISSNIYDFNGEFKELSSIRKNEILKCVYVEQGLTKTYICGDEYKGTPELDLNVLLRIIIVFGWILFWQFYYYSVTRICVW